MTSKREFQARRPSQFKRLFDNELNSESKTSSEASIGIIKENISKQCSKVIQVTQKAAHNDDKKSKSIVKIEVPGSSNIKIIYKDKVERPSQIKPVALPKFAQYPSQ